METNTTACHHLIKHGEKGVIETKINISLQIDTGVIIETGTETGMIEEETSNTLSITYI